MQITGHPQDDKNRVKVFQMMKEAGFYYVRISSYQKEVIDKSGNIIGEIQRAGLMPLPICGSDNFGIYDKDVWAAYSRKFTAKLNSNCQVVQILNEPNTQPFTGEGVPVRSQNAFDYFKISRDIIKARFPNIIIIAPGLTCENKSVKDKKISAHDFIRDWMKIGAHNYFDFWALHYYDSEKRFEKLFFSNIDYARTSRKDVLLTETGSSKDPIAWYKYIKEVVSKHIKDDFIAWYCFTQHKEFEIVNSATLKPNPIYNEIKKYQGYHI